MRSSNKEKLDTPWDRVGPVVISINYKDRH
jgi:hypothetical protein